MNIVVIVAGVFFALFSSLVMSYISIATMVGPWIAPTLVLLGQLLLRVLYQQKRHALAHDERTSMVACMQAIGAGGGIIATGIGFVLPTLYFLEPETFNHWLACPWRFCSMIMGLCLSAGGLGLLLGRWWAPKFIDQEQLPFPVSQLTHQMITSQTHADQSRRMFLGVFATTLLCFLRDGVGAIGAFISKTYYVLPTVFHHELGIMMMPAYWAIGFSVGLTFTVPLLVGMISKYIVLYPLMHHAQWLPWTVFEAPSMDALSVAFCSGIILCELVLGLKSYVRKVIRWLMKRASNSTMQEYHSRWISIQQWMQQHVVREHFSLRAMKLFIPVFLMVVCLLTYFGFSPLTQLLLVLFTIIATHAITKIGGEIGMIPFGRFSTFIILPLLIFFGINAVQVTIACVFFDICAATASDLLFDYKTGDLCGVNRKRMYRYQWIGLLATAIGTGLFLWLLFTNLQLGSETLFAQRSRAKSLLIQSLHFDLVIVGLGIMFGMLLKRCRINPTMVFGGLIMPNTITLSLLFGSLFTRLTNNTERWQSLCAGVLAAESLWIIISIVIKMVY